MLLLLLILDVAKESNLRAGTTGALFFLEILTDELFGELKISMELPEDEKSELYRVSVLPEVDELSTLLTS
jgi:hypothetical protein